MAARSGGSPPDFRIEVTPLQGQPDPDGQELVGLAGYLTIPRPRAIRTRRLYFLRASLSQAQVERLCDQLLCDPALEGYSLRLLGGPAGTTGGGSAGTAGGGPAGTTGGGSAGTAAAHRIEVSYQPGVADREAESLLRALRTMGLEAQAAQSGWSYEVEGDFSPEQLDRLAQGLLLNPVIQTWSVGQLGPHFQAVATPAAEEPEVLLRRLGDEGLAALGRERRLALSLTELQAVRMRFREIGREPTLAELETIAQTWSEHCAHKTFKAEIEYQGPEGRRRISSLLEDFIRRASEEAAKPWVISAFTDNAGLVSWEPNHQLAYKVETHNHPSALEPFGGANTGVGGVVRDVLGVSARPIAGTDVLCFGPRDSTPPPGALHPRRVEEGVIAGIADYGNKLGLPTVAGAILYDEGYLGNPLVYCGCLGLAPRGSHPTRPRAGDLIVLLGGRTGRDGLGGATFSSAELETTTQATVVQIGQPITEKGLIEAIVRARDAGLYHAVTDCGAGGLSSAVGEMAARLGAEVRLEEVPLKYPGLAPWEIWLSEAQERMVLAVPPEHVEALRGICRELEVGLSVIGRFTGDGRLRVSFAGRRVVDLAEAWLHEGRPRLSLAARWTPPAAAPWPEPAFDPREVLLRLLAHPNIRSRAGVIRRYDHQVQGATVVGPLGPADGVGPLVGAGPSDGVVLSPLEADGRWGVAIGHGINPWYGRLDPWAMGWAAVDEAVRNVVAAGADPERIALLDNFCWGDPWQPETLGALVRACQGAYQAARAYDLPFISGKDSLNNTYRGRDVPGTLLVSALGWIPQLDRVTTTALKRPGSALYLIGRTRPEYGGSHLALVLGIEGGQPPQPAGWGPAAARAVHGLIGSGLVLACHDVSEGGLGVALAEMALAGGLGLEVEAHDPFAESQGRYVVEVAREEELPRLLDGVPHQRLGRVVDRPHLRLGQVELGMEEVRRAWAD